MSRRAVEHGPNHDLVVLLTALAALALIYAAGRTIAIDEPSTQTPTPPRQGSVSDGRTVDPPSRGAARNPLPDKLGRGVAPNASGRSGMSGEAISRPAVGHHWRDLAACESSNNPRAVSPGGTYRGLFQFDAATWASVGGTGDPAAAPRAEQLARAQTLQARRGWSPWPQCAAQLGLLP